MVRINSLELGTPLFEVYKEGGIVPAPNENHKLLTEYLATVQRKTKTPILIPERDFTNEEIQTIVRLHQIVTTGKVAATWDSFSVTMQPNIQGIKTLTRNTEEGKESQFILDSDEVVTLFDTDIRLGRVRRIFKTANIANIIEIYSKLDEIEQELSPVKVLFEPGTTKEMIAQYYDYSDFEPV